MTHRITEGSPMKAHAARFGAELVRAMAARQVGQHVVSAAAGVGRSAVVEWRHGRNLPTSPVARRVSEALRWPKLLAIVFEARTRHCQVCDRSFIQDTGRPRKFCNVVCRNIGTSGGRPGGTAEAIEQLRGELLRVGPARKQVVGRAITLIEEARTPELAAVVALRMVQDAVAAMCTSCEPEGYCKTPECPLRTASPLPMAFLPDREVEIAVKPAGPFSLEANAARADANRRYWQGKDRSARQAQAAPMLRAKAAMTPEARAAMNLRIGTANAAHNRDRAAKRAVAS